MNASRPWSSRLTPLVLSLICLAASPARAERSLVTSPEADGAFVQITGHKEVLCGLRADGTVKCWSQAKVLPACFTEVPEGPYQQIDASSEFVCGLRTDGDVTCWGQIQQQPENVPACTDSTRYQKPAEGYYQGFADWQLDTAVKYKTISVGDWSQCGITTDGLAICKGYLQFAARSPTGFNEITTENLHTCMTDGPGRLTCIGPHADGAASYPDTSLTRLSAGQYITCGLDADTRAVCWGYPIDLPPPPARDGIEVVADLQCFDDAKKDTDLCKQDIFDPNDVAVPDLDPKDYEHLPEWQRPYSYSKFSHPTNEWIQLMVLESSLAGTQTVPSDVAFSQIVHDSFGGCGLKTDGTVACWGMMLNSIPPPETEHFTQITFAREQLCGLIEGGRIRCWGNRPDVFSPPAATPAAPASPATPAAPASPASGPQ